MTLLASKEKLEDAVTEGKEWLIRNPESASRAVLLYDGFIPHASGKTNALIVEAVRYTPERERFALVFNDDGSTLITYTPEPEGFVVAVPYRHANSREGFAVYQPKFFNYEGPEVSFETLEKAFFRGVNQHEKGAAVWNASLDQSE